ncbi:hypothetical protein CXB51_006613 [Gossypium anomalum]|uniref:Uncharacterized protein n=1 Tax=Gossypium anomalum TaxID=47600 RepID=A0A8J5ZXP9_9ROSI|nr:hypothetical protein CXB51_006613 [Gossypium anomalum]
MYLTSNSYQIARVQDALLTACKLANVFLVKYYFKDLLISIFCFLKYAYICFICSGIAVSMVMKYADNIVKLRYDPKFHVYSTSVAMLLTAVVSVRLQSYPCFLPRCYVSYLWPHFNIHTIDSLSCIEASNLASSIIQSITAW